MREKLNNNPLLQVAVIGVLLLGTGFFVLSSMGGGEEAVEAEGAEATVTVAGTGATGTATGATPGEAVEGAVEAATGELGATSSTVPTLPPGAAASAPPPPSQVTEAYEANRTVVLLFVREGGIDDELVLDAVESLKSLPEASTFVVPADRIARYASITQGVAVDRVPALVVIRPKHLGGGIPAASVSYGFQSPESVLQAVVDAGYKGRTLDYHP
jgi:hypothetical protein